MTYLRTKHTAILVSLFLMFAFAGSVNAYNSGPWTPASIGGTLDTMSETGAGTGVYGDLDGYKRVLALETALDSMSPGDHPRIHMTASLITAGVLRAQNNTTSWQDLVARADTSTSYIADNALVALIMANDSTNYPNSWADVTVQSYVDRVVTGINAATGSVWGISQTYTSTPSERNVAVWALGLDWTWDGLTQSEREAIIDKIASHIDYAATKNYWDDRTDPLKDIGIRLETFHREAWCFYSWRGWPEIVLSGHNTTTNPTVGDEAQAFSVRRWKHDTMFGDALRWMVYQDDGQAMEGYQHGTVGLGWFIPLATAFGIDHWEKYMRETVNQELYELDLSPSGNRTVFHYGSTVDTGGIYGLGTGAAADTFRHRDYMQRSTSWDSDNPFSQWYLVNLLQYGTNLGSVSWVFSQESYFRWSDMAVISDFLYYDDTKPTTDPTTADYATLPTGKVWGHHRAISRTSWDDDATLVDLKSLSATTRTSHTAFVSNYFQIYRDGNLSGKTGFNPGSWTNATIANYASRAISVNQILLRDTVNPGYPLTQTGGGAENYGGSEGASFKTFGYVPASNAFSLSSGKGGTTVAHSAYSDEHRIVGSQVGEYWDWFAADGYVAYQDRVTEITRQMLVAKYPDSNNAYITIFDRIDAPTQFKKTFVQHFHDDPFALPTVVGATVPTVEVPGHIVSHNADGVVRISMSNPDETYVLHTFYVLPVNKDVRIIGGRGTNENCNTDGYDFYWEGSTPGNAIADWWPEDETDCTGSGQGSNELMSFFYAFSGVSGDNFGTWRTETTFETESTRGYFLTVSVSQDVSDPIPTLEVLTNDATEVSIRITNGTDIKEQTFYKTGDLGGAVSSTGEQEYTGSFSAVYTGPQSPDCQDDSGACITSGDCSTYWPTYNWCTDTCQEAACSGGEDPAPEQTASNMTFSLQLGSGQYQIPR